MRQIKFRAWDEEENKMIEWHDDFFHDTSKVTRYSGDFSYIEMPLMQYTGLKDKNGVEIYENDVVKGYWWRKGEKNRFVGRVTYVMSSFRVRGVKQYFGMDQDLDPTYEVIGNIHENPELLEATK